VNPLFKHFSLDSKGLCLAWHDPRIDGLNGLRPTLRVGTFKILDRVSRPGSYGLFPWVALLRFRPKNMAHHIFQLETELQTLSRASFKELRQFLPKGKA
jgi:hypothetical protein